LTISWSILQILSRI